MSAPESDGLAGDLGAGSRGVGGTLLYDGACGFCRLWIEYWRVRCQGGVVRFEAYQSARLTESERAECAVAVQWRGGDGSRAAGAEAVFLALSGCSRWCRIFLWAYRRVPLFRMASRSGYRLVAANRSALSVVTRAYRAISQH